jgi:para-aminobenzoate synthetase / 4-amino-4-deoxychorismate lyase
MLPTTPFVLLDDARPDSGTGGLLFRDAMEIIQTREPDEVRDALERLRTAVRGGLHAAGFLGYEAGASLDRTLAPLRERAPRDGVPLLWFGLFVTPEAIPPDEMPRLFNHCGRAWASPPSPLIERDAHAAAVARIKAHIEAGDIYQANLTFQAEVAMKGDPPGLYAGIRRRAAGGHGALLFTGEDWLLSFSPELFFTLSEGRLTARPMKGTSTRSADTATDRALAAELRADPKQRAENLMIVDLLRNDLSRVSRPGSVQVPALFDVETYPTVHQMTSTVTAELEDGLDAVDVIGATFPCGSITGAPKLRATRIIHDVEERRRGAYTGSIGHLGPEGNAAFNVAIRTLWLREGGNVARIGLGSGIVADSEADAEWSECLAKGAFVASGIAPFDLIETMRFDPEEGLIEIERHLGRLTRSAAALGFAFDRHQARNELQAATFRLRGVHKLRLLLSPTGALAVETRPMRAPGDSPLRVALRPLPVSPGDFRLRHKTSDRAFYDDARRASGADEVIFHDKDGRLTEGSFTNLFVPRGDLLLTPPLTLGLLPGVLRERLVESGEAIEAELRAEDLGAPFFIGNSLRRLLPARLAG